MKGYNLKARIKEEEVGGKCSLPHLTDVADAAKILAVKQAKDTELSGKNVFCLIPSFYLKTLTEIDKAP